MPCPPSARVDPSTRRVTCRSAFAAALLVGLAGPLAIGCGDDTSVGTCEPDDADGVVGGKVTFAVIVDDTAFKPMILTAQNRAEVTLTLENVGTKPWGLVIGCLPTPNDDGCPTESCMPGDASIAPIEPGESTTTTFEVPVPEGIHTVRATAAGDGPSAQFIVK